MIRDRVIPLAWLLTAMLIIGGAFGAGLARADDPMTDTEWAYAQAYGKAAICKTLDDYPTEGGVYGIAAGIHEDGFDGAQVAHIVNYSVENMVPPALATTATHGPPRETRDARMTDPAVEAAQRAWATWIETWATAQQPYFSLAVAAAREALKPIRELHCKTAVRYGPYHCRADGLNWPCDTAKLAYPESEL